MHKDCQITSINVTWYDHQFGFQKGKSIEDAA